MFDWIVLNKEWLFSGVAIALPLAIVGWLFSRRAHAAGQRQRSGHNSTNVQVGGNVTIKGADRNGK